MAKHKSTVAPDAPIEEPDPPEIGDNPAPTEMRVSARQYAARRGLNTGRARALEIAAGADRYRTPAEWTALWSEILKRPV